MIHIVFLSFFINIHSQFDGRGYFAVDGSAFCIRWELSKSVANLIELTQIKSKRKTAKKICCERATKKQTENDKKIEESEKNTHTNRHRIEELAESRNARCLFEIYLNLFMWSLGKRRHGRNDAKVHTQANDKKQKLNETNTNEVNKRAHQAQTQPSQFGGGTKKHPFLKHRQTRITAAIAWEKLPNTNIRIWCFCGFFGTCECGGWGKNFSVFSQMNSIKVEFDI